MKVLIVEDERPAAERLERAIAAYDADIEVAGPLQTVSDTVEWFKSYPDPDLVFLDVRLTDGLSLEVFERVEVACPVIFTTAYDAYILDAFECNSIDYLLKPVKSERLVQALEKYDRLRRHFGAEVAEQVRGTLRRDDHTYTSRLVVQRGTSYVSLEAARIRYAFSEEKTTFLVDAEGVRYLTDEALTALEDRLDPRWFFRVNRSLLAHIDAVASFKPISRGRMSVEVRPPFGKKVVVSQAKAARFRSWLER